MRFAKRVFCAVVITGTAFGLSASPASADANVTATPSSVSATADEACPPADDATQSAAVVDVVPPVVVDVVPDVVDRGTDDPEAPAPRPPVLQPPDRSCIDHPVPRYKRALVRLLAEVARAVAN